MDRPIDKYLNGKTDRLITMEFMKKEFVGEQVLLNKSKDLFFNREFEQSIKILSLIGDDEFYHLEFWKVMNHIKLGDIDYILNSLEKNQYKSNTVEYLFLKGITSFLQGDHNNSLFYLESVKPQLQKLIKIDMKLLFEYFMYLGMTYHALHYWGDAIDYYKVYLNYKHKNKYILNNLFYCYLEIGEEEKARIVLDSILNYFEDVNINYYLDEIKT